MSYFVAWNCFGIGDRSLYFDKDDERSKGHYKMTE